MVGKGLSGSFKQNANWRQQFNSEKILNHEVFLQGREYVNSKTILISIGLSLSYRPTEYSLITRKVSRIQAEKIPLVLDVI